jgi:molybdate transport system substrate-binding protein
MRSATTRPSLRLRLTAAAVAVAVAAIAATLTTAPLFGASATSGLTVFAAASLTDVFPAIDSGPKYSFAGSNALAGQITLGAPADVFASANTTIPAQLFAKGIVEQPVNFTRNTLVIVVPTSNPAGIHSIYDLAEPGVKLDIANSGVPVGSYTLQILNQMNLAKPVLANVVSQETDVREVLAKVAAGQVDAGFVYATDAQTVAGGVTVVKVPAWAQPKVTYAMAVIATSSNQAAAKAFLREVLGRAGQAKMLSFGFLPLTKPKDAMATAPPKTHHKKR